MSEPKVLVFFHGSYMNRAVLREVEYVIVQPARDLGFPDWYISRLQR